jgi:pimeloyl-ACP methyl ester carboxylesterase
LENSAIHLTQWARAGHSDPVVVMVHGGAQGGEVGGDRQFAGQSRLSLSGWRVIAPDRPGHGRSPSPGRPDDAEADGVWVAELLGAGGHLVGHSFGGCVALAAAMAKPEAVRSLTLIEPAMHALAGADPRVREFFKGMIAVHAGNPSAAEVAARFMKLVNVPAELRGPSGAEEMERLGDGIRRLKLPSPDWLRASLTKIKALDVPTLVVTGGWSPAFDAVCDAVAELSGGEKILVPSAHHLPQFNAQAFNDRLIGFMRAAEERARSSRS